MRGKSLFVAEERKGMCPGEETVREKMKVLGKREK